MQEEPTASLNDPGTKERILLSAESLVAERGFDRVSLRDITAAARVNLAAVHYHFDSKDGLVDALILRYVRPIYLERLRLVDRAEAACGARPVPVEKLIEIFIRPVLEFMTKSTVSSSLYLKMVGRCMGEHGYRLPAPLLPVLEQATGRFAHAFRRSLPGLPEEVILWRMHFCFGAVVNTLLHGDFLTQFSGGRSGSPSPDTIVSRLIEFCAAGLHADCRELSTVDQVIATDLRTS